VIVDIVTRNGTVYRLDSCTLRWEKLRGTLQSHKLEKGELRAWPRVSAGGSVMLYAPRRDGGLGFFTSQIRLAEVVEW
jgi:hypothetical protein